MDFLVDGSLIPRVENWWFFQIYEPPLTQQTTRTPLTSDPNQNTKKTNNHA